MCGQVHSADILVTSCWRDREKQQAIRDTWGILYRPTFFLGGGTNHVAAAAPDELFLDIPDDYQHVPWKTRQQCRWALMKDLDHVFICDVDTYVDIPRLFDSDFRQHDYVGWRCDEGHAAGGNGYWLSRRGCKIIADTECPPQGFADLWVGRCLARHGIFVRHDHRYGDGTISRHLSVNGHYNPDRMYEEHVIRRPHEPH